MTNQYEKHRRTCFPIAHSRHRRAISAHAHSNKDLRPQRHSALTSSRGATALWSSGIGYIIAYRRFSWRAIRRSGGRIGIAHRMAWKKHGASTATMNEKWQRRARQQYRAYARAIMRAALFSRAVPANRQRHSSGRAWRASALNAARSRALFSQNIVGGGGISWQQPRDAAASR